MLIGGVSYTRCACMGACNTRRCTCASARVKCTNRCHPRNNILCRNMIGQNMRYVYPHSLDRIQLPQISPQGAQRRGITHDKCECRNGQCSNRCPCIRTGRYCFFNCHHNNVICNNNNQEKFLGRRYAISYPRCQCNTRCNNHCRCNRTNKWCHNNCHPGRACRN